MSTIHNFAVINFVTHSVNISLDEDHRVYCFKYVSSRCDIASFDNNEDAVEWIIESMPSMSWRVDINHN